MDQEAATAAKRRPNAYSRELRRARSPRWRGLALHGNRPRGATTDRRIRQIVSDTLKKRIVDAPADHALLQLPRLEPALRLAAGAVADGDVGAIRYYLKLLDQLDRYQPGAATPQAYDDAARERLYAKMGRIAARLQAKTAKRAAGPPLKTERGDPMRGGEAGFKSERREASEKIPPASTASP